MDKAKKRQSVQVASCTPDDTQTENDECTEPEDVLSADSQSCSSEDVESNKGIFGLYLLFTRLETVLISWKIKEWKPRTAQKYFSE